jgi:hypothetical protein
MKVVERTQTLKMFVGGRWVDSESGIGRVGGHRAIEQMTDLKTIVVDVQEH